MATPIDNYYTGLFILEIYEKEDNKFKQRFQKESVFCAGPPPEELKDYHVTALKDIDWEWDRLKGCWRYPMWNKIKFRQRLVARALYYYAQRYTATHAGKS